MKKNDTNSNWLDKKIAIFYLFFYDIHYELSNCQVGVTATAEEFYKIHDVELEKRKQ